MCVLVGCRGPSVEATRSPEAAAPSPEAAAPIEAAAEEAPPGEPSFAERERAHHQALAVDARDRGAFEGLARLYYDRGMAGESGYLGLAERVIDQGERALAEVAQVSAELAMIRGQIELARARPDRAHAAFSAALRVEPTHALAALQLARIELGFRDSYAALVHLEVAAQEPTLALEAKLSEGVARFIQADFAGARAAFGQAHALAPTDPRPFYNLGLVEAYQLEVTVPWDDVGQVRLAIAPYERFLTLATDHPELAAEVAEARARVAELREHIVLCEAVKRWRWQERRDQEARVRQYEAAERERLLELERKAEEAAAAAAEERIL